MGQLSRYARSLLEIRWRNRIARKAWESRQSGKMGSSFRSRVLVLGEAPQNVARRMKRCPQREPIGRRSRAGSKETKQHDKRAGNGNRESNLPGTTLPQMGVSTLGSELRCGDKWMEFRDISFMQRSWTGRIKNVIGRWSGQLPETDQTRICSCQLTTEKKERGALLCHDIASAGDASLIFR